jgi:hypothetical protein
MAVCSAPKGTDRFGGNNNGLFLTASFPQIGFDLGFPQGTNMWTYGTSTYGGYLAFGQDGNGAFSFATAPTGTGRASKVAAARQRTASCHP